MVHKFADRLQQLNYNLSIDRSQSSSRWTNEEFTNVSNKVKNSKLFVCFVNKDYCEEKNSKLEISFAHAQKTKIISVILEKETKNSIDVLLSHSKKILAYQHLNESDNWFDAVFEELLNQININFHNVSN